MLSIQPTRAGIASRPSVVAAFCLRTRFVLVAHLCLAVALLLALANPTSAQTVVVSNLAEASSGSLGVSSSYDEDFGGASRYSRAGSFTTGSSTQYLDNITLAINGGSGSGFSLALYSNSSSAPGSLIHALSGSTAPTSAGNYAYIPTATTLLNANTTYWWVASVPYVSAGQNIQFNLKSTGSLAETSSSGWTIGDRRGQQQNDTTWQTFGGSVLFSVSATSAIPEPGTYAAFAGLAALGLAAYRRRKSRGSPQVGRL